MKQFGLPISYSCLLYTISSLFYQHVEIISFAVRHYWRKKCYTVCSLLKKLMWF